LPFNQIFAPGKTRQNIQIMTLACGQINYLCMMETIIVSEIFIDILSDFGFKRMFTREHNKNVLIDLLNSLLKLESPIVEIEIISNEQIGDLEKNRKSVFDIQCKDAKGNYFIIEVQKLKEAHFKDRSVYYSTFPIRSQEKKVTGILSLNISTLFVCWTFVLMTPTLINVFMR
jgi:hypothetical protein